MKRLFLAAALATVAIPALATDVGVSISIAEPGFYGRIDLGGAPRPQVVYAEPVIIQPVPVGVVRQPIYLYAPPAHVQNWGRYCGKYNACGQPVYFVQENWYNTVYVPHYREKRGGGKDKRGGGKHERGHGKGHKDD